MRAFFEEWVAELEPNRQLTTGDLERSISKGLICQLPTGDLTKDDLAAFLRTGFTHHIEIMSKCKTPDERWYYIQRCSAEFWSVESLKYHIRANDFGAYGAMPNNFVLTIPNEKQASRAARSFKDEYLLDFVNIEEETEENLIDEPELHSEIVEQIRKFIMALGNGFWRKTHLSESSSAERQKRQKSILPCVISTSQWELRHINLGKICPRDIGR